MLEEWFFELMRLKNEGLAEGAEKGYSMDGPLRQFFNHFKEEWKEFVNAYEAGKLKATMKELADLSNMCDLLFEELFKLKEGRR